ncbi:MAG: hypothetical protein M1816_004907 [Peltula sp. TS41687]|nr:MAG: hypothetical protein M1816_004907 [Peltula sp. TS41687]
MKNLSPESFLSLPPDDIDLHHLLLPEAHERLAKYEPQDDQDRTVDLLTALLSELPQDGVRNLCEDIRATSDSNELWEVANHIFQAVIRPMRGRSKTPTPALSPLAKAKDHVEEVFVEVPEPAIREKRFREDCLRRDGNKCVVTGCYDIRQESLLSQEELSEMTPAFVEAAHILPFSLGQYTKNQEWSSATIWEALYRYFPSLAQFKGEHINDPSNGMILLRDLHLAFGSFMLAFESTGTEHTYNLKMYQFRPGVYAVVWPCNNQVTFATTDPQIPLPNPKLLEAHAAIARVLQATGMGEFIEKSLREREGIQCLASDGSTDVRSLLLAF